MDKELRDWADRFAITGVEWLHEINRHIWHDANAPDGTEENSWLAMEGCRHHDCIMGRKFRKALQEEEPRWGS